MGGKTAQSSQQVQIPASVLSQYESVNSQAQQTAAAPFQQYGGQFVAPVNSQQQSGIAATNASANEAQPAYAAATGTLGQAQANTTGVNNAATGLAAASASPVNAQQIGASQISQFENPYLNDVLGSTSALLNQNNAQAQTGALGTAIQSGAFGGDRTGIAAANLEQQQDLTNANVYSGIASNAFNTALGAAQQQQGVNLSAGQANRAALGSAGSELASIGQTQYGEGANTASELGALGSGAQSAGLQGAQAQIGAGTVEQQTQQAQDTAQYNQFLQQQSYPFQVDQFLANIAEGTGALSGSTTTTQQPGGFFSDKRLKHDIKRVGKTFDGQDIVSYKMHGDDRTRMGLIAQDVEKKHPDAVGLAAGYKIVDYGKATEKAANRGHFYEGGVVPMRRAYAMGGGPATDNPYDLDSILSAQQQMYAPMQHRRDIPSEGGAGGHQLAVASGSPAPPPSGSSKVSQSLGLGEKGYQTYKHFNTPSSTPAGGGVSPADAAAEGPATDTAAASAAQSGAAADAAAPAAADTAGLGAADAAGAGAGAAGTAAAGAAGAGAVDAGATEAAAALAAEYAAADAAIAVAAAKRGGAIRGKMAAGGTPYESDGAGTPYQDPSGAVDIPDTENSAKLQTAGPIKKQPTGLQTLITMGNPNDTGTLVGGMFSNSALARGGVAGRRGYDDGGSADDPDMLPEQTVEAQRPDPITYTAGLDPVDRAPIEVKTPDRVATGVKPDKDTGAAASDAPTDHWWKHAENVVPLLSGLAAMGTAPTRSWGRALATGLGAGAQSWLPAQEEQADVQGKQIHNQGSALGLQAARAALAPQGAPPTQAAPTPSAAPAPSDPMQLPAYYQQKYATPPMSPAEAATLENSQVAGGFMKNPGIQQQAQTRVTNRIQNQTFKNQQAAQLEHDQAYQTATTATDPAVAAAAAAKVSALRQWTGDTYKDEGGTFRNLRTNKPAIGDAAQTMSVEQKQGAYAGAIAQANEPVTIGAGLPTPRYHAMGYTSDRAYADHITGGLGPQGAPGAAPAPTATIAPSRAAGAPARVAAPAAGGAQPAMLPGVNVDAIPKLPPIPAATDQPTKARAEKRAESDVGAQNEALAAMRDQAAQAARNTAIYSQLEHKLATANPREFGPSSASYKALANLKTYLTGLPPDGLVNQAEVDKYLSQLGVGGSKQLLGADQQLRQQEMMLLMAHANPNIDQPLQVIKNLAAFGKAGNDYDLRAANTGIAAIRGGADPYQVPGAIESQAHRSDYIGQRLGQAMAPPTRPGQQGSGAPAAAIAHLQQHPELAPQFKAKYGYLPQ